MTPAVWLALTVAVIFMVGTMVFILVTAPRHQSESERRARRLHPSWPHNTPPHTRHHRR